MTSFKETVDKFGKIAYLFIILLLSSCGAGTPEVEEIPLAPLDRIVEGGTVIMMRAPLHVRDPAHQLAGYTAAGERTFEVVDEVLFPTDVIVIFTPEMDAPTVFLARSPHGGCLLLWKQDEGIFEDPCYGSRFDLEGKYRFGPSPRDLDKLPSEVRGNMLWVKGEIVYGEEHP